MIGIFKTESGKLCGYYTDIPPRRDMTDEIMKLDKKQTNVLSLKFFNDTFLVDQNACSSPHVVFWLGKKNDDAKKTFQKPLQKHLYFSIDFKNTSVFFDRF